MAKLNWNKLAEQKKIQPNNLTQDLHQKYNVTWQLGKYKNTPLTEIPTNYLLWVRNNFDSESVHREKALLELQRRKVKQEN